MIRILLEYKNAQIGKYKSNYFNVLRTVSSGQCLGYNAQVELNLKIYENEIVAIPLFIFGRKKSANLLIPFGKHVLKLTNRK